MNLSNSVFRESQKKLDINPKTPEPKNYLEDQNLLDSRLLNTMDKIKRIYPDVVFGGSIALVAVGLLNRPVGDIDCFVDFGENATVINKHIEPSSHLLSETVDDIDGYPVKRSGGVFNGVKICLFQVHPRQLEHIKYRIFDEEYNIQNVNWAIIAKKSYANRTYKHNRDLKKIIDFINELD